MKLNRTGLDHARRLIAAGRYLADHRDAWSGHKPTIAEEDEFTRMHGMDAFARWHLGVNEAMSPEVKGRYWFPYGDFAAVHRCAVLSAKTRAGQYHYQDIHDAATQLLRMIAETASHAAPARVSHSQIDIVDEASLESFPASDPPSWTPVLGERSAEPLPSGDEEAARRGEAKTRRDR